MGDGTGVGDGDNGCSPFSLPRLQKGEQWLLQHGLRQKFCSNFATDQIKCADEFVLADDYDTNYSLLLSLARKVEPDSRQPMGCYLYQLHH